MCPFRIIPKFRLLLTSFYTLHALLYFNLSQRELYEELSLFKDITGLSKLEVVKQKIFWNHYSDI
jgi:hypothetical protein